MRHKLLKIYCFLLLLAASTMIMLWQFVSIKEELSIRDYPDIQNEGILRIAIQNGDTESNAFYYELSHILSNQCNLEFQLLFFETSNECMKALQDKDCDVVVSPVNNKSFLQQKPLWTLRKESHILKDSINYWLQKMTDDGTFQRIKDKYFP